MFHGIDEGTWTFTKIREARDGEKEDLIAQAKKQRADAAAAKAAAMAGSAGPTTIIEEDEDAEDDGEEDEDAEEGEVKEGEAKDGGLLTPAAPGPPGDRKEKPAPSPMRIDIGDYQDDLDEEMGDGVYVEDEDDEEGAVWCMKEGRVTDWGCFFALLYAPLRSPPDCQADVKTAPTFTNSSTLPFTPLSSSSTRRSLPLRISSASHSLFLRSSRPPVLRSWTRLLPLYGRMDSLRPL